MCDFLLLATHLLLTYSVTCHYFPLFSSPLSVLRTCADVIHRHVVSFCLFSYAVAQVFSCLHSLLVLLSMLVLSSFSSRFLFVCVCACKERTNGRLPLLIVTFLGSIKPCPHCRRKVRQSHFSATVQSHFSATVSLSHFTATVWTGLNTAIVLIYSCWVSFFRSSVCIFFLFLRAPVFE